MDYLTSTLSRHEAQRLPVASVAWYDGPGTPRQTGQNEIVGKHPCSLGPSSAHLGMSGVPGA